MSHEVVEKNSGLLIILIILVISIGGLVEIVPLFFLKDTTEPIDGLKPYTALQLEGRDVYIKNGCNVCHSQMIRPFRAETERYGHYSLAGESVWEHPFLWGSKRTGPDLARVGGRYSDDWHRIHLTDPRAVVPESNMPGFPWFETTMINSKLTPKKLKAFNTITRRHTTSPLYSDADIAGAEAAVEGKTEMDAMIAYLQVLGTVIPHGKKPEGGD